MSRPQWVAIEAVRRIAKEKKIKGLHGLVVELFETDPNYHTAVEVTAGNQLLQMVVDTDETATALLRELQRENVGRVTFMPLNRIRPGPDPPSPDASEAVPLMRYLNFAPKFKPAISEIFRKAMLVKNLEVGTRLARSLELDCVTIAGDQVNRKGAMTGGYLKERSSRIGAQREIVRLGAEVEALASQQAEIAAEVVTVDQRVTSILGELTKWELAVDKATAVAELEALDLPGAAPGGSSRAASAHKAVDAQKERAHAALLAAAATDRERLAAIEAEMSTDLVSKLTSAEKIQLSGLHDTLKELTRTRDAADSDLAKAEGAAASLRDQLDEHLRKRQEELQQAIEGMDVEEVRDGGAGGGEAGSKQQQLDEASTSLGAIEESLAIAAKEKEKKRDLERSLQAATEALRARMATERAQQAEEAKQVDRLLSRRGLLLGKVDEFSACIRKLGMIPKDALDGVMSSLSSKVLLAEIDKCAAEVAKLGYVNKKALDQCVSFAEERDRLLAKQEEMDAARESIEELIEHLDHKKDEAIERTFKGVSMQFVKVFLELVPGGEGSLVMTQHAKLPPGSDAAARLANYAGVAIKVRFPGSGVATSMAQLSGGQKTMVALCLIFAIQRCDPAPFYIFDEIDAALDATHRSALASMIEGKACAYTDEEGNELLATQFVTTTFRPELIDAATKCFGVTHARKASTIKAIEPAEAQRIIAEDQNRQRQHIGVSQ